MLGGLRKGNVPLFLKEMNDILKKNPALKDKLAELPMFDEYRDIQNQYAALDTGTMTDVYTGPKILKKETEEGLPAETLPAIAAATYKPVKALAKGAFRGIVSPLAGAGFATSEFVDINPFSDEFGSLKEDPNVSLAGIEMLYPDKELHINNWNG